MLVNVLGVRRQRRSAGLLVICVMLILMPLMSVIGAQPSEAAPPANTCTAFPGATPLGAQYSDSSVTVPACGPRPYPKGPQGAVYPYPGAPRYTDGYQCVEFSERFLYYKFGVAAPNVYTDGDQIVDHYSALYPGKFTVENSSNATELAQGDVLSFAHSSTFNDRFGGHTAVVQSSTVNAAGTGDITIIEQNASPGGERPFHVNGWTIQGTGYAYIKWMHFTAAPAPKPPASGRPLDIVFAIDTTGSMEPYIASVVSASSTIVDALDSAHADYRIGLVDYKDSDFGCGDYDAVTDLPFSSDKAAIESALSGLEGKVGGGCDIPEDVYSGVSRALGFPWRTGVSKAVIVMGDAPGHDPEPHSGLTLAKIKAQAAAVDPAQVYSILIGTDPDAHAFDQALADATGGQTFDATSDPSQAGSAFVTAVQTIIVSYVPSSTALKLSSSNSTTGAPVQFQAAVTPGANAGSVTFLADGVPLLDCQGAPVNATGTAACTTSFTSAGNYDIQAVYSGDDTLAWSQSSSVVLSVHQPQTPMTGLSGNGGPANTAITAQAPSTTSPSKTGATSKTGSTGTKGTFSSTNAPKLPTLPKKPTLPSGSHTSVSSGYHAGPVVPLWLAVLLALVCFSLIASGAVLLGRTRKPEAL